jgi:hypothetical protein
MKAIRLGLGSFLFVTLFSSIATAQAQRTFVSGLGSDSNPCSRTAPCRTLTQALMGTSAGGEVVALDSAGYGPFAITQAVSVIAPPGVYAGISVFSGDGIDINAASTDSVILRGLTINNQGSTGNGIVLNTGGTLHIEGCVINGFSTAGNPAAVRFLAGEKLEVKDSIIRGNNVGILINPSFQSAMAAIDQVRLEGNITGLSAENNSTVTIRNSVASGGATGLEATSDPGKSAELNIESCMVFNNTNGIFAFTGTGSVTIRVSNCTVTDNNIGLYNFSGSRSPILSRGNNTVEGNTTNTMGTIGSYSAK